MGKLFKTEGRGSAQELRKSVVAGLEGLRVLPPRTTAPGKGRCAEGQGWRGARSCRRLILCSFRSGLPGSIPSPV